MIYLLMRTKFHQHYTTRHVVTGTTDRDLAVKTCNEHNAGINVIHDAEDRPYPLLSVVDIPSVNEVTSIRSPG